MKHLSWGLSVAMLVFSSFHGLTKAEGGASEIDPIHFPLVAAKGISFVTNPSRPPPKAPAGDNGVGSGLI